jgi:hypothetical protein
MTGLARWALTHTLKDPAQIRGIAETHPPTATELVRSATQHAVLEIRWVECSGMEAADLKHLETQVRAQVADQDALWSRH